MISLDALAYISYYYLMSCLTDIIFVLYLYLLSFFLKAVAVCESSPIEKRIANLIKYCNEGESNYSYPILKKMLAELKEAS